MSSSQTSTPQKPCPSNSRAYFSERDKILYICLREDEIVERNELEQSIQAVLGGSNIYSDLNKESGEIVQSVFDTLRGLRDVIRNSINILLGEEVIDVSLPKVWKQDEKVSPGEFAGDYPVGTIGNYSVVLHVEPKIGWNAYTKMLYETSQSIDVLVLQTGILEPLLGNLYYPSLSSPISYSILLLRLTNLILSSSPPKKTTSVKIVSEGVVGRPVILDTLKYMWQGLPLGAYERVRIEIHDYPYMLLARFHYDLYNALKNPVELLRDVAEFEKHVENSFYGLITSGIKWLLDLHSYYLTTPPLSNYLDVLFREDIGIQELLEETRRAAHVNPYFRILADLYEMYINDIGLINEYIEKGMIVPCASSKIYELWILTRIINFLNEKYSALIKVETYQDLYIKYNIACKMKKEIKTLQSLSLVYNMPQEWSLLKDLVCKKYQMKIVEGGNKRKRKCPNLRPDYILEGNKASIVYDAKYKLKISPEDVKSILTYIVEYARPVMVDNKKTLLGVFYKLTRNPKKPGEPPTAFRNDELPVKIKITLYPLDPRMDDNKIKEYIELSLQPLLTSH